MRKFVDTLLMLIVGIGCFIFTRVVSGGDGVSESVKYNLIFLSLIIILYFCGLVGGFFKMKNMSDFFERDSDIIKSFKGSEKSLNLSSKMKLLMGHKRVDPKLNEFVSGLANSQSGICDIEDYINDDEVDNIIKKWFLDLIPDIMTSLGILGTFVGLVWGMRGFDPSSYDMMSGSVASLIDGIKVAFLTSIYGLAGSLLFQYSMNRNYSELIASMQDFIDRFHSGVVPSSEYEAQNRMVHSQNGQYELLRGIGMEFQNQIGGSVNSNMEGQLRRINESIEELTSVMQNSQESFSQDLRDSYRDGSNERLINTLSEICQKNNEMLDLQRILIEKISDIVNDGN